MNLTGPALKDNSPLAEVVEKALGRFGEMSASTVDLQIKLMFVEMANEVIDDVLTHPYRTSDMDALTYYDSIDEVRPIPDNVLLRGLVAKYSEQQDSNKKERYMATYYDSLNKVLYQRKFGGAPLWELNIVDKPGTNVGAEPTREPGEK